MPNESTNNVICPFCGESVDQKLAECPVCGAKLFDELFICPRCTASVTSKDAICPLCGVKLATEISKVQIEGGSTYVVTDENFSYRLFKTLTGMDYKGLILSKMNLQKIEKKYSITDATAYWLTATQGKEKTIDPQRLDFELMYTVSEFVKNNSQSVTIIDALTLLISSNGGQKVGDFIKYISDLISTKDSIVILPVQDNFMEQKDYDFIKEYVQPINYKEIQNEVTANKEAEKMRIVIRKQNITGKKGDEKVIPSSAKVEGTVTSDMKNDLNKKSMLTDTTQNIEEVKGNMNQSVATGPIRIKLRDSETGAVLEMELDIDNTIDELIESAGAYWEKATGVYVIRKGNKILRGNMRIGDADVRDGDIIELIPDPEGGK